MMERGMKLSVPGWSSGGRRAKRTGNAGAGVPPLQPNSTAPACRTLRSRAPAVLTSIMPTQSVPIAPAMALAKRAARGLLLLYVLTLALELLRALGVAAFLAARAGAGVYGSALPHNSLRSVNGFMVPLSM